MPDRDEFFMARALENAKKAWGQTHPNPMVGAVIVKNGKIIAEGWHEKDGEAHAEINAINSLKESAEGAEIFVTLEPCSTRGRTGACAEAILKRKFARVVIGALDPNPLHSGRALEIFKAANVECVAGVLKKECEDLNIIFNRSIASKSAMLAIKIAQSSNGKIAEARGMQSRITEDAARINAHKYRELFPAIAVGLNTLLVDNPSLTRRANGVVHGCPARLILDRSLSCAALDLPRFKVFADEFRGKTFIVCDDAADYKRIEFLEKKGVKILQIPTERTDEKQFWRGLKSELYKMRLSGLLLEGGAKVLSSAIKAGEADYLFEYTSPKTFPENAPNAYPRPKIIDPIREALAPDTLLRGFIK